MNKRKIIFSKFICYPAVILLVFLVVLLVRDFSFTREKIGIAFTVAGLLFYFLEYIYIQKKKQFFFSTYIAQLFLSVGIILVIFS